MQLLQRIFRAVLRDTGSNQIGYHAAVNFPAVLNIGSFGCCFVGDAFFFGQSSLLSLLRPDSFNFNSFLLFAFSALFSCNARLLCDFCCCLRIGFTSGRGFEFCPALFFSVSARAFFCLAFDLRFSFPLCRLGLLNAQALKLFASASRCCAAFRATSNFVIAASLLRLPLP
ncbi:hypothetical protein M5585_26945 [Serratia ureilytica]